MPALPSVDDGLVLEVQRLEHLGELVRRQVQLAFGQRVLGIVVEPVLCLERHACAVEARAS